MIGGRLGPHRDHLVVERPVGCAQHGALRGVEGRRHRADQGVRPRVGRATASRSTPFRRPSSTRRWPGRARPTGNVPSIEIMGEMVPLGRAGTPDDIAAACSYLCSEEAGYITGPGDRRQRRDVHLSRRAPGVSTAPDARRRIGTETSKTRGALLDAAEQLMLEEGYAAVTSRRVAADGRPEAPARPLLLPHHGRPVPGAVPPPGRAGRSSARPRPWRRDQPLWALWDLSRDPRGTALTMEFIALANHRKAIRAEITASAERFRAEQLRGLHARARALRHRPGAVPTLVCTVLLTSVSRFLGHRAGDAGHVDRARRDGRLRRRTSSAGSRGTAARSGSAT